MIFAKIPGSDVTIIPPKYFGETATIAANDNNQLQYSWDFYNVNIQINLTNQNGGVLQNMVPWDNEDLSHRISLIVTNDWGCERPIKIDTVFIPLNPHFDLTIV